VYVFLTLGFRYFAFYTEVKAFLDLAHSFSNHQLPPLMPFVRIFPLRISGQYQDSETYKARLFYDIESEGELVKGRDCEVFFKKGSRLVHPWSLRVGQHMGDLSEYKTFMDSLCFYIFHELRYYLEADEQEMQSFYIAIDFKDVHFSVFSEIKYEED